jgi:hypothetical protein
MHGVTDLVRADHEKLPNVTSVTAFKRTRRVRMVIETQEAAKLHKNAAHGVSRGRVPRKHSPSPGGA